jgi:NAD(P)-dependent dehydrogenase (short-subunit alcohol dehydrogenase family)
MVNISTIRKSNAQIDSSSTPRVAVFVGGTAGIGKLTLMELAALGTRFKAYVIGRKGSKESFTIVRDELQQANPNAQIIWIDGEVSLLSEVKRICSHIKTLEASVDLLFMTAGYAPLGGRQSMCEPYCSE